MTDSISGNDRARLIGRTIAGLRTRFVKHERYLQLAEEFDLLLYRRLADIEAGHHSEARGLVVTGASGSGKTTAIRRLFAKHPDLHLPKPDVERADVISFMVPAPATLKSVGHGCLHSLGYPQSRDRSGPVYWSQVQKILHERRVLFLHLDEVQHLYNLRANKESQAVVNTLKSLMQQPDWPTGLVLSGTKELQSLVNMDEQLSRRLIPVEFPSISATTHASEIASIINQYGAFANLTVADELQKSEFLRRLIHAASKELGLAIEFVVAAIEDVLWRGESELSKGSFTRAFARRSGCSDAGNPLLAEDWRGIDSRKLFDGAGASDLETGAVR